MQVLAEDAQQMMAKVAAWCSGQPVKLCLLFGSQATGRQRPDSDVDLAIWPDHSPSAQTKLIWLRELETLQSIPGALEDFAQFVAIFADYQSP